MVLGYIFKITL